MYLDISYGWQQRMDVQALRKRRRRAILALFVLFGLLVIVGSFALWHWL